MDIVHDYFVRDGYDDIDNASFGIACRKEVRQNGIVDAAPVLGGQVIAESRVAIGHRGVQIGYHPQCAFLLVKKHLVAG